MIHKPHVWPPKANPGTNIPELGILTRLRMPISQQETSHQKPLEGFPGGTVVKNPPANAGDTGLSPGPGRSHMLRSN